MRDSLNLLRLRKIKNFHINLKALKFYAKENLFARVQLQICISSSGANFHENGITQIF